MQTELPQVPHRPPEPRRTSALPWVGAAVGGVVVLGAIAAWWTMRRQDARQDAAVQEAPAPSAELAVKEAPAAASLEGADERVRAWAAKLSTDPVWLSWASGSDVIRRIAGAAWSVSQGDSPRAFLPFLAPKGPFEAEERDGVLYASDASFARYDRVADVVSALDLAPFAEAWRELQPFLSRAHEEIAPRGKTFTKSLDEATEHLLQVKVPESGMELVEKGAGYAYADPGLEGLSAAQKHLVRMGPRNAALIQSKLRELRRALGLPE